MGNCRIKTKHTKKRQAFQNRKENTKNIRLGQMEVSKESCDNIKQTTQGRTLAKSDTKTPDT